MLKIHSFLQRALKPVKDMLPLSGRSKAGITAVVLYAALSCLLILSPDTIYEHSSRTEAPVYTSGNSNKESEEVGEETAIEAIVRMNPIYFKGYIVQGGLEAYGTQYVNPYVSFMQSMITKTAKNDSDITADKLLMAEEIKAAENSLASKLSITTNLNLLTEEDIISLQAEKNSDNLSSFTEIMAAAEKKTAEASNGVKNAASDDEAESMDTASVKEAVKTENTDKKTETEKTTAVKKAAAAKKEIDASVTKTKDTSSKKAVQAAAKSKVDSSSTKEKTIKDTAKKTESKIKLNEEDTGVLQRIVEAEATGEDIKGKMLVANVILNRVKNKDFPDSVKAVVFQKSGSTYQFSPIKDGRYYSVKISESTKKAVNRVLQGEDYSQGALYFSARIRADKNSMSWFDRHLTYLFKHGGHEFFK
ncbi:cell wall hydrolase [Anaerocolumna sp. AGMB13020]|uniref:cell wall hydrolase n=1 Tax=Anaerocolumna sp. AGMB13020 TaxID=3081750 RepID=UPI0029537F8F|nr:cell wall hydrolase [Anaerocolumna sp. AGMB13020]WOO35435.1 cell wall hydrolase [Anaerocolumna sp. AGMB13020]